MAEYYLGHNHRGRYGACHRTPGYSPFAGAARAGSSDDDRALANVIGGAATLLWGGNFKSAYSGVLPGISLKIGTVSLPPESFIGFVVSAIVVIILMLIFRFTKAGLAM